MRTARRLRTVAFRGRFWAALVLPLCLVAGAVAAGGGLLMAGFVVAAVPIAGLLALPPLLATWVGHVRSADDVPLPYAVVTVVLWVVAIPVGFLLTYTQPLPAALPIPRGYHAAEVASAVVMPAILVLWVAQVALALVGRRARRRPSHVASGPGTAALPY
ncbi:hypothetical protein [Cellulosimicrobium protaetiae]|uniref:Uncharacterized protein n=1 Tax=Cellulosimicrobium protaetiae TaxID=2587808 RepID=A0A6M5UH33_9MICO|nr:hypothetical protein [Cellulosimicrobium protaetiae]QJW37896.1 hypothetical protein FIC82_018710 [Cellulosimicrobium protaetiae]